MKAGSEMARPLLWAGEGASPPVADCALRQAQDRLRSNPVIAPAASNERSPISGGAGRNL